MQYLYIIKCQNFHKIGIANDVESRLAQLSTGNPYPLEVQTIYEFENAEPVEKAIHQRYKSVRQRGEWFTLGYEDLKNIHNVCLSLGGSAYEYSGEQPTEETIDEAEHDYVLTSGISWRLEARTDRSPAGFVIMKRGIPKEYLGYIRGCDLLDSKRPTVEEVEKFLSDTVGSGLVEAK